MKLKKLICFQFDKADVNEINKKKLVQLSEVKIHQVHTKFQKVKFKKIRSVRVNSY